MERDDFSFHDKITLLDTLIYQDWDKEEEDEPSKECNSNNRINGIKFFRTNFKPNNKKQGHNQNQNEIKTPIINN